MEATTVNVITRLKVSANNGLVLSKKYTAIGLIAKSKVKPTSKNGVVTGTVKEKGAPVSRRVFCYERNNGSLAATTTSNINGEYRLEGLAVNPDYYVVSLDENGDNVQYNAVIQDLIRAKKVAI